MTQDIESVEDFARAVEAACAEAKAAGLPDEEISRTLRRTKNRVRYGSGETR